MKSPLSLLGAMVALVSTFATEPAPAVRDSLEPLPPGAVRLEGIAGRAIDVSVSGGLKRQDVAEVLRPFQERRDVHEWRSEFWGKWITAAIPAWRYAGDGELREITGRAVSGLLATQTPDGYIGAYPDGGRLQRWDIWGRKYTLLGLLAWHDATQDAVALAAAQRHADFLLGEVGPGKANPFTHDMWSGMATSSIIEPMVLLYRRTGETRYLDFAKYLVDAWTQPDGPDLLNKGLANVPVFRMFEQPNGLAKRYSDHGKSKAYEMMSNYEGLLELHRVTGDPRYLTAVRNVHASIRDTEITLIGSGSDWERWYDGRRRQTETWAKGMETCVTVTWIKLNAQLLRLTGEPSFADEIERATYNAFIGAEALDGAWWCHHMPLAGIKERAPDQCGMHQNCCVASGPRGLVVLPAVAVMNHAAGPVINLYGPSSASVPLSGGGQVRFAQSTRYPFDGDVEIAVTPDKARSFELALRIPAWSERTEVTVNGRVQRGVKAGSYMRLNRKWKPGDVVKLSFDFRGRVEPAPEHPTHVAVSRGPLVLARDVRLQGGSDINAPVALRPGQVIELEPVASPSSDIRAVFRVEGTGVQLCDFASAGNTWTDASRFRVWMPVAAR